MITQRPRVFMFAVLVALVVVPLYLLSAQTVKRIVIGGGDAAGTTVINELGAIILEQDSTLTVVHIMEKAQRPKAYRDVDLAAADTLLMVNGKRTKTVSDLDMILDSLVVGDAIKMAIKRGKDMRMVSFAKADSKDLPPMKMMTMSKTEGKAEGGHGGMETKVVTRTIGGDSETAGEVAVLMGSGIIAMQDSNRVVIADLFPLADEVIGAGKVKKGDHIIKLQGKPVKNTVELQKQFDAIAVGTAVELTIVRDGKESTLSFKKAEPRGIKIKRGE